jgi:WD40-like Beta Propeller Repeat
VRLEERAHHASEGIRRAVDTIGSATDGDVLERFTRYRERRQRKQRLGAVALTAAVALATTVFIAQVLRGDANRPASVPTGLILYGDWNPKIQQAHWNVVRADGSGLRDLNVVATCARWWPDGSRILITDDAHVGPGSPLRPATTEPDGSGFTRLDATDDPDLNLGCGDVSPDGSRIALEGFGRGRTGVSGIYTVRASDGGDLVRLTEGRDSYPQYAPDGDRLAFFRTRPGVNPDGAGALFVLDTDGTEPRRITPWGFAFLQFGWSPDGRWIVFEHPYGQLYLVHPDGFDLHPLPVKFPSGSGAMAPQWSPDGAWIAFTLQRGEDANVFVVRPDGTGLRAVTHGLGFQATSPDWSIPAG